MKRTKLNKKGKSKTSILQSKCDKALQLEGKRRYKECEICGKPINCLHHFFPKSVSARLRYEWDNLIPICMGCHFQHHSSYNPSIHATVIEKRGLDWYNGLNTIKREYVKTNVAYYEEKLKELTKELKNVKN